MNSGLSVNDISATNDTSLINVTVILAVSILETFVGITSLTHCGRVTQICVFNTVKLGTSASSP